MKDSKVWEEFRTALAHCADSPNMWVKVAQTLNERGVSPPQDESWTPEVARKFHEQNYQEDLSADEYAQEPDQVPEEEQGAKVLRLVHSKTDDTQQEALPAPVIGRVFVEVQSSAKSLSDQIASFLKRELRSLKDVEIGNTNPKWRIIAMATTQAGLDPVAFMYLVSETLDLHKHLEKVDGIPVKLLTDAGVVYEHVVARGVRLCPQSTLQEVCRQIVATFDTDVVEPARTARRK
jgi:hypothetical protein